MSTTALVNIPIDIVDPPTMNPRWEATDLDELSASIREVGILEPLIVVKTERGRVRLVAGLRRFTAAIDADLETVPCVVHDSMTEREELAISLVENLHRKDMSPIETGEAFQKLCRTGLTQLQVANMVGVSDFTVSNAIKLATQLHGEARDACHRGDISKSQSMDICGYPKKLQEVMLHSILHKKEIEKAYHHEHPTPRTGVNRSKAESALRMALKAIASRDRDLAIQMTTEALTHLKGQEEL